MSNDDNPQNLYEVGYRKPPKAARFEKGQSGNPKGRPKGAKNLATIIEQVGRQPVRINGPRGTRTVTKNHAVVLQLAVQAAQGSLPAIRSYIALLQSQELRTQDGQSIVSLHEIDESVMKHFALRIQQLHSVPSSGENADTEKKEPD